MKPKQLIIKVNETESFVLYKMAREFFDGNVSAFLRYAALDYKRPRMDRELECKRTRLMLLKMSLEEYLHVYQQAKKLTDGNVSRYIRTAALCCVRVEDV